MWITTDPRHQFTAPTHPMKTTETTQPTPRSTPNPAWTPGPEEIAAYKLGISEAHHACGMTYDDDPESPRSVAYDWGRNVGEINATGPANWKALLAAAPEMAEFIQAIVKHCDSPLADCVNVANLGNRARAILARLRREGGGV